MQFIDEDDGVLIFHQFLHDGLQAFFKLAAIFCTGHDEGKIERQNALIGQEAWHVTIGDALKQLTGIDIVNQQLGYLMRAGAPDSLDRMVATSYGRLVVGLIDDGLYGQMVALRAGVYTTVPIETSGLGTKRVDVAEFYDTDHYRPKVGHLLGKPMFLY